MTRKATTLTILVILLVLFMSMIPYGNALGVEGNQQPIPTPQSGSGGFSTIVDIPFLPLSSDSSIGDIINGLLRLAVVGAGFLAVIFIIYGGFEYMISGAREAKKDGKGRIQNAIFGLLLLLLSYVILSVINPDLLNLDPFRTGLTPGPGIERSSPRDNSVSEEDRKSIASGGDIRALRTRSECREAVDRAIVKAAKMNCTTSDTGSDCTDYKNLGFSIVPQSSFVSVSGTDQSTTAGTYIENRVVRYDAVEAELRANPTPGCELPSS